MPPPLRLEDAAGASRGRDVAIYQRVSPDPRGLLAYRVHVVAHPLDGEARVLTPANAIWAQLAPGGGRLAWIAVTADVAPSAPPSRAGPSLFDQPLALVVTDVATGAARVVVGDVMPARAASLRSDLPPTLQWRPDGGAIAVQSAELDDGDGQLDRATVRVWDLERGALLRELHRPVMAPYLWTRGGGALAFPSLDDDPAPSIVELATLRTYRRVADLHVNQTLSMLRHPASFSPTGTRAEIVDDTLLVDDHPAVTGPDLSSPAWSADGRRLLFASSGAIYTYDLDGHLALLGPGIPSPLFLDPAYRPPSARAPSSVARFALAFRTF